MKNEIFKKMFTKDAITGWVIVLLFFLFIGMSIEPAMNDTRQFFTIMGIVLGGGVASGFAMMWFFETFLPNQGESTDNYEEWIKENTDISDWDEDSANTRNGDFKP